MEYNETFYRHPCVSARDDKLTAWAINSTRRQLRQSAEEVMEEEVHRFSHGRDCFWPRGNIEAHLCDKANWKMSLMKFRFLIHFCTAQAHMTIKCFLSIVPVAEVSSSPVSNNDVLLITRCGQRGLAWSPSHRGVRGGLTATFALISSR